jgi:hypothetical protein
MARMSKWDVLDRGMRLIVYLVVIYLILKLFKIL